jgi:hypothetical protein
MSSANVPFRVDRARESSGQTEIVRILDWEEPPERIVLHSESQAPTIHGGEPGPEVRELAEIIDWFEERGILLVFTARGAGVGEDVRLTIHSANLIDHEADQLVARFEARTRLISAREARDWWLASRESKSTAAATSTATSGVEAPAIPPDQRRRLKRRHVSLVITGPDADDPESGWMIEAYSKEGKLLGIAVAATAQDAYLTIYDDLFPGDSED